MANVVKTSIFASISLKIVFVLLYTSYVLTQSNIVFQPSFITTNGPQITAYLLGNASNVSLTLWKVSLANTSGSVEPHSHDPEPTRWLLTTQQMGKTVVRLQLRLNQTTHLCIVNDTDTDCCNELLCILETLQVTAHVNNEPQTSLLIQVNINARLFPALTEYVNKTIIPNQAYQPLGPCPCDLTLAVCDIRCCCDKDCSSEDLELFAAHCLAGPFGGQVSPDPDYQCSVQSTQNSPDWFPFLCVISPPENNPNLGLFYYGDTITPKSDLSFQSKTFPYLSPVATYVQGSPLLIANTQYFTIPQKLFGQCSNNAPVAFLKNFQTECVTRFSLDSCPTEYPLKTLSGDLSIELMSGKGDLVKVNVIDEIATDLSPFVFENYTVLNTGDNLKCENVTLALDYKIFWQGNSITAISLTRTIGTLISDPTALTTRYSAVFLCGNLTDESKSGNPGYLVGKPVIGGIFLNDSNMIQRASINTWKPMSDGLCSTAEKTAVLFGENTTSGCLLPVGRETNLTQCDFLRETIFDLQVDLISSTHVAKVGNPDVSTIADWINISFVEFNSNETREYSASACHGIPSHQQILVWVLATGQVNGVPQMEIQKLQISYNFSTWTRDCGGEFFCEDIQLFPITYSVTFIDIATNTGPPKTRYQINFTEYDCNRNDVCWPEFAFPFTRFYTGEPYSQSLAKGMILVFFFITASIFGTPWKQIRQIWQSLGF